MVGEQWWQMDEGTGEMGGKTEEKSETGYINQKLVFSGAHEACHDK